MYIPASNMDIQDILGVMGGEIAGVACGNTKWGG